MREVLTSLPPREAFVIRHRYGLAGLETRTYPEIAERLGITRQRIRQLAKQALKRLKRGSPLLAWASSPYTDMSC
ncbi:sigma-70 family RNA polymerase sigma factor [Nonomuraea cavernae]|uniref:sigma-70 family RNA polymerase sigma factor n=1 Tax=Nonomuraea cavernae TaxID=2045107 RepID=UPI003411E144